MTLNLTESEMGVLEDLSAKKDLSKTAVLRQALRLYQLVDLRLSQGAKLFLESADKGEKAELMVPMSDRASRVPLLDRRTGEVVEARIGRPPEVWRHWHRDACRCDSFELGRRILRRIGLHSLPQSEKFYKASGMSSLGSDLSKQSLCYLEDDTRSGECVSVEVRKQ